MVAAEGAGTADNNTEIRLAGHESELASHLVWGLRRHGPASTRGLIHQHPERPGL